MSEPSQEFSNYVPSRHGRLAVPVVGEVLTVTLPGETTRAEVVAIQDDDHIVCKIGQPMAKSHSFVKGQKVRFHRAAGMQREHWVSDS